MPWYLWQQSSLQISNPKSLCFCSILANSQERATIVCAFKKSGGQIELISDVDTQFKYFSNGNSFITISLSSNIENSILPQNLTLIFFSQWKPRPAIIFGNVIIDIYLWFLHDGK